MNERKLNKLCLYLSSFISSGVLSAMAQITYNPKVSATMGVLMCVSSWVVIYELLKLSRTTLKIIVRDSHLRHMVFLIALLVGTTSAYTFYSFFKIFNII